jgi:collagen type IV alpha-3-binding protein
MRLCINCAAFLPFYHLTSTGTLSKWTNYIHGWQDRFIALKDGTLVYYKSEFETDFGCRGAISIDKATVKQHEIDELRFDVSVSDCVWYLRAPSVENRQKWIDALEIAKRTPVEAMANHSIGRYDSAMSLTSTSSLRKSGHNLHEKLSEMETFKDILSQQIDKLGTYIDQCAKHGVIIEEERDVSDEDSYGSDLSRKKTIFADNGRVNSTDFKAEAITFKATANGILFSLTNCIDILARSEDQWRKRYEREQMARKRIEEKYRKAVSAVNAVVLYLFSIKHSLL